MSIIPSTMYMLIDNSSNSQQPSVAGDVSYHSIKDGVLLRAFVINARKLIVNI